MKFAISSHEKSYRLTYHKLVYSLLASGVPPDDIYFFIGGHHEYFEVPNSENIHVIFTDHNSFDISGLISVLDLNIEADAWFLLHDTCYVGENFYKHVMSFNHEGLHTIALAIDGPCMCMGSYSYEYLQMRREEIMRVKNRDYSEESLQNYKKLAIDMEDYFLHPKSICYNNSPRWAEGPLDYYGSGVMRVINHFDDLQLYKVQANWTNKETYELNT